MCFDRPLLMPKTEEQSVLARQRETLIARMNMFIRLRQDLERVCFTFCVLDSLMYFMHFSEIPFGY